MTVVATDNFNRASIGPDWTTAFGGFTINSSTTLRNSSLNNYSVILYSASAMGDGTQDIYIEIEYNGTLTGADNFNYPGICLSTSGTNYNNGYHVSFGGDGNVYLSRRSGGSSTDIATVGWTRTNTGTIRLEWTASTNTLAVYLNDVLLTGWSGTTTDTAHDVTHVGVQSYMGNEPGTYVLYDNFEGGTLGGAPTGSDDVTVSWGWSTSVTGDGARGSDVTAQWGWDAAATGEGSRSGDVSAEWGWSATVLAEAASGDDITIDWGWSAAATGEPSRGSDVTADWGWSATVSGFPTKSDNITIEWGWNVELFPLPYSDDFDDLGTGLNFIAQRPAIPFAESSTWLTFVDSGSTFVYTTGGGALTIDLGSQTTQRSETVLKTATLGGPIALYADDNNLVLLEMVFVGAEDAAKLYKRIGGTWTELDTTGDVMGFTPDTLYDFRLEVDGLDLFGYVDDVLVVSGSLAGGDLASLGTRAGLWGESAMNFDSMGVGTNIARSGSSDVTASWGWSASVTGEGARSDDVTVSWGWDASGSGAGARSSDVTIDWGWDATVSSSTAAGSDVTASWGWTANATGAGTRSADVLAQWGWDASVTSASAGSADVTAGWGWDATVTADGARGDGALVQWGWDATTTGQSARSGDITIEWGWTATVTGTASEAGASSITVPWGWDTTETGEGARSSDVTVEWGWSASVGSGTANSSDVTAEWGWVASVESAGERADDITIEWGWDAAQTGTATEAGASSVTAEWGWDATVTGAHDATTDITISWGWTATVDSINPDGKPIGNICAGMRTTRVRAGISDYGCATTC